MFDRVFFENGAELVTDIANDSAEGFGRFWAALQLGDAAPIEEIGRRYRMKPEREARIRKLLVRCAEKDPARAEAFIWWVAMFDPALWLADMAQQTIAIKRQGDALRSGPEPAEVKPRPVTASVSGPAPAPAPVNSNKPPAGPVAPMPPASLM